MREQKVEDILKETSLEAISDKKIWKSRSIHVTEKDNISKVTFFLVNLIYIIS